MNAKPTNLIARGRQPAGLSLECFMRHPLPDDWDAQREAVGGRCG